MGKYIKRSFTIIPNDFNQDGRILRLTFEQRAIFLECILKSDDLGLMKIDAFQLAHNIKSTESAVIEALDVITTKLRLAYRYPYLDYEILLLPQHTKYQIPPLKRIWDLQSPLPKWEELSPETQKAFPELGKALPKLWNILPENGKALPPVYVYVSVNENVVEGVHLSLEKKEAKKPPISPKPKKRKKLRLDRTQTAAAVSKLPIPPDLRTPEFHKLWEQWKKIRNAASPLWTPDAAEMQLKKLARYSVSISIEALEIAIASIWRCPRPQDIKRYGIHPEVAEKAKEGGQDSGLAF